MISTPTLPPIREQQGTAVVTPPPRRPRQRGRPSLENGDRLNRVEFERRYLARPDIKRAELIEGVVHMPSPIRFEEHSEPHGHIATWLGTYKALTPGVRLGGNATLRLDMDNELEPDALLRLEPQLGGKSYVTADGYLAGAPELIVEVAASSVSYDLHDKLHAYRRNGVQEYLVLIVDEEEVRWHVLEGGEYHVLRPDQQGVLHSRVFPGLWLQPDLFWADDLAGLLAVLDQGLQSPEHTAFVAKLSMERG
ncbi:MAG: Uma2 family endonuclease [Chloroflexota bacterium]